MSRLDDAINRLLFLSINDMPYILNCLKEYSIIVQKGDCNSCGKKKTCEYLPELGKTVRYNCPHYIRIGEEGE